MNYQEAYEKMKKYGQEHALKYYDTLSEEEQQQLLDQIETTDFSVIETGQHGAAKKGVISPLGCMQLAEIKANKEEYTKIGIDAIKAGRVAAVLLAGGMGTRLGSDDPKGMYNIGETKDVFIFQRIVENIMDVVKQADGTWIHLFVMTSDKNHEKTVGFFKEKNYFGYNPDYVTFFMQEMAPATDYNGKVYMEAKNKISTSPNGNGGWFSSMNKSGVLDIVEKNGIEYLNVFAVDNVLQRIADPCFVGATIAKNCEVGAKVVKKNAPDEKVGVMCLEDGRPSVVEYYELTDELMNTLDENGERVYNFGVILNYLFEVKALIRVLNSNLPLHVVEKKIPFIDENGTYIKPEEPNGYKYETLILDMIHELNTCLPYEADRNYEFAPIKNKTGIDSVESARALLKENGYTV